MPRPIDARATYYPALDGLRAVAVGLVIAFHLGFARFSGGLLGVGVFFTLSGFLIARVLLGRWHRRRVATLGPFWIHRVRRLVPAMVLVVGVGMVMVLLVARESLATRGAQVLAALLYVANWHTIWTSQSYFARFAARGPFDHLWSLSVEEQFYLVWPPVLLGLIVLLRNRFRQVSLVTLALAAVSFGELALLAGAGFDNTRAYEGTDTRAGGLLLGAALALWMHRPPNAPAAAPASGAFRGAIDAGGMLGLVGIVVLSMTTNQYSTSIYRWGLLVLSLATCAVLVAICTPGSLVSRILGVAPLRWVGERSYGLYLWHLPVMVFAPQGFLHSLPWVRDAVLVAASLVLSAASWAWVEDPIRRTGLRASLMRRGNDQQHVAANGVWVWPGIGVVILLALCTMLITQVVQRPGNGVDINSETLSGRQGPRETTSATNRVHHTTTRCRSVVYIGDSTSEGIVSANYLPRPGDRIPARLNAVGVTTFHPEIAGARSIIETWGGMPNAQTVARKYVEAGYRGCWILALGTNDTANYSAGGPDYATRIEAMMRIIPSSDPVMWVNVKTRVASGFYSAQHAVDWDNSLVTAARTHPNMRIYDWANEVKDPWFISDNIHFNTPGYRQRSVRIARALANAFPGDDSNSPILVGS